MPEIGPRVSGDGKRGVAEWPKLPRPSSNSTANRTYHGHRKVDANDPKYDIGVLIGNTLRRSPMTGSSLQPAV